jgi:hypothetical protein
MRSNIIEAAHTEIEKSMQMINKGQVYIVEYIDKMIGASSK